jgi:hypothetical protein
MATATATATLLLRWRLRNDIKSGCHHHCQHLKGLPCVQVVHARARLESDQVDPSLPARNPSRARATSPLLPANPNPSRATVSRAALFPTPNPSRARATSPLLPANPNPTRATVSRAASFPAPNPSRARATSRAPDATPAVNPIPSRARSRAAPDDPAPPLMIRLLIRF